MKEMAVEDQIRANGGFGRKCSICGQKFYTERVWGPIKNTASDQCRFHRMFCHNGRGWNKLCR